MKISKLKLLAAAFIIASLILYVYNNQNYTRSVTILNIIGVLIFIFAVYKDVIKNKE